MSNYSFLERTVYTINSALKGLEAELTRELNDVPGVVLFILGAPRSGTTLLSQVLAHAGTVGYISNFLARFWEVPYVGSLLEQHLGVRETHRSTYESAFGATSLLAEPHEFTRFWERWFGHPKDGSQKLSPSELQHLDGPALKKAVASLEAAWNAPMMFKNTYWCNFQTAYLARLFERSLFVWIRRDPLYAAQSIALAREQIRGSRNEWWSMKPPGWEGLLEKPWWFQVAGQVVLTELALEKEVASVESDRLIRLQYEDFCQDPKAAYRLVVERMRKLGVELTEGSVPDAFRNTNRRRLSEADFELLQNALETLA